MRFIIIALVGSAVFAPATDSQAADDVAAVKEFLATNFAGKKWHRGPAKVDTPEVRQAYPGKRFFVVRSGPPLPPGAPLPELLEQYQRRLADYRENYISLAVVIDKDGELAVADRNVGMMPINNEDDARIAAAAVLALDTTPNPPPGPVSAEQVKATKTEAGWQCQVDDKNVMGSVEFDKEGKVTAVTKRPTQLLVPPSAPPSSLPPSIAPPKIR